MRLVHQRSSNPVCSLYKAYTDRDAHTYTHTQRHLTPPHSRSHETIHGAGPPLSSSVLETRHFDLSSIAKETPSLLQTLKINQCMDRSLTTSQTIMSNISSFVKIGPGLAVKRSNVTLRVRKKEHMAPTCPCNLYRAIIYLKKKKKRLSLHLRLNKYSWSFWLILKSSPLILQSYLTLPSPRHTAMTFITELF